MDHPFKARFIGKTGENSRKRLRNASNIYEVLLALPFGHALRLLKLILKFLEAVTELGGGRKARSEPFGTQNGAKWHEKSQFRPISALNLIDVEWILIDFH